MYTDMNCEQAQERMVLLAYDELSEDQSLELQHHLNHCTQCATEMAAVQQFYDTMAISQMPEVPANLLAESRMRLDDQLDELGVGSWRDRARAFLLGSWSHVMAAPALTTLLIGTGFLGGSMLVRYQVAHQPRLPSAVVLSSPTSGTVANVSGIEQTPDSSILTVKYNRIVPEQVQGSLDDPQIRELLLMGAKNGITTNVRESSVGLLASECQAGRQCESAAPDDSRNSGGQGVRDALLVSLRYDHNPGVRLKALQGLEHYVAADQHVRDAVLESLMHDDSADVRSHALDILQPVQADSSVRRVLHTVSTQDANPYIRNASTQALEGMDGLQ